ncbi:hypothetical protein EBZ80_06655 [bacterium]|nr:hypothetical protein [bacterium]
MLRDEDCPVEDAAPETGFDHDEIFINLKVISRIKPGDKISVRDNLINIAPKYFLQGAVRWLYQEDRMKSVSFIVRVVDAAFSLNEKTLMSHEDRQAPNTSESRNHTILRLTNELDRCIEGLNNMKQTYADDRLVECRIDYVIDQIKIRVNNNSKLLEISSP